MKTFESGAKARSLDVEYRLIPMEGLRRLALRYTAGLRNYEADNWKKGLRDKEYLDERKNHMVEHLWKYLTEGNAKDDNLAAVVWGAFTLMEAERVAELDAKNETRTAQEILHASVDNRRP